MSLFGYHKCSRISISKFYPVTQSDSQLSPRTALGYSKLQRLHSFLRKGGSEWRISSFKLYQRESSSPEQNTSFLGNGVRWVPNYERPRNTPSSSLMAKSNRL